MKQEEILTTFEMDTISFQRAIGEKISSLLMIISMVLSGLAAALFYGWILTMILLAFIPLVVYSWNRNMNVSIETASEREDVFKDSDMKVEESLTAIKLVKEMNAEEFEISIQERLLKKVKSLYESSITKYVLASGLAILTLELMYPLTLWYSG